MGPGMMGDWGFIGWFGGLFVLLIWILSIVGLIMLIKLLIQAIKLKKAPYPNGSTRAIEILNERYARGEIDKQEFEEKKRDLSS